MDTSDDPTTLALVGSTFASALFAEEQRKKQSKEMDKLLSQTAAPGEDSEEQAASMLSDEVEDGDKARRRILASVDTTNWLQPTLSRPAMLGSQ